MIAIKAITAMIGLIMNNRKLSEVAKRDGPFWQFCIKKEIDYIEPISFVINIYANNLLIHHR